MSIHFKQQDIVVPGQLLAEGDYRHGNGAFKERDKIFAAVIGLVKMKGKTVYVVPLQGQYIPKARDIVIGTIIEITLNGWLVDIHSPYPAMLPVMHGVSRRDATQAKENLRRWYDVGETVVAEILAADRTRDPLITTRGRGLGKIRGGVLTHVIPTRVPRLIGRKGSMINMLKTELQTDIVVGQNGVVWVKGRPERVAIALDAIHKIQREAHTSGLTDRIRETISAKLEDIKGETLE
ncbi:MAG: exosome complex RNA-binding protein Rrp4 [Candidatus Hermodarchaeota archaeon]|nr:exosome complex RNA-binding protein Rrp4 [Candidatus Hermodarchaeota archaeon]